MARRQHLCDVPGCRRPRKRWQRLCSRCFDMLPWAMRNGILANFASDKPAHRTWCKQAAEHLAYVLDPTATPAPKVDAQQAYQRTARMMGEHDIEDAA
jgi:hypothetical protein